MGNLKDKLEAIKAKIEGIKTDYNDSIELCDTLMGVNYKAEAKKISSQLTNITQTGSNGEIMFEKSYKAYLNLNLNQKVSVEEANEIAQLVSNGSSGFRFELHNAMGSGSIIAIGDGYITFCVGDMAHAYFAWKENSWRSDKETGPLLDNPYWFIEQAYDIIDQDRKSPLEQEDLTKIERAFDNWAPINMGYAKSNYVLSSDDKENISKRISYIVKFLGMTFTEVSE